MGAYIVVVKGRHYVRVVVPQTIRGIVGLSEIRRTMGDLGARQRQVAAGQIGIILGHIFASVGRGTLMEKQQIQAMIDAEINKVLDGFEAGFLVEDGPASDYPWPDWEHEEGQVDTLTYLSTLVPDLTREIAKGDFSRFKEKTKAVAAAHGIQFGSPDYWELSAEIHIAWRDAADMMHKRMTGVIERIPRRQTTLVQSVMTQAAPVTSKHSAQVIDNSPLIRDIFAQLKAVKMQASGKHGWGVALARTNSTMFNDFVEWASIGNIPVASVTKVGHIWPYIDNVLKKLPPTRSHAREFKGADINQVMELVAASGGKYKAPDKATVNRNFTPIKQVFDYAQHRGYITTNPCEKVKPYPEASSEKGDENKTAPFEDADIPKLFAQEHVAILRVEQFWLMAIAYFTGMRCEEIAQLHGDDVYDVDGGLCFDINRREIGDYTKKTKNAYSLRVIPLSDALFKIGLKDYLRARGADAKDEALFPDMYSKIAQAAKREAKANLSGWFTKKLATGYLNKCGVVREHPTKGDKDFHSFRATFNTLQDFKMDSVLRQMYVGHERPDISGTNRGYLTYDKQKMVKLYREEISKAEFHALDLTMLSAAWRTLKE